MQKFNEEIKISISVDMIAERLVAMFNQEEKHAEIVVETIIGCARHYPKALSMIYNSMNGFTGDINFEIGDIIDCKSKTNIRRNPNEDESYQEIGLCEVIGIDRYASEEINIKWTSFNTDGTQRDRTNTVSKKYCSTVEKPNELAFVTGPDPDLTARDLLEPIGKIDIG